MSGTRKKGGKVRTDTVLLFRWTEADGEDIANWKQGKLTWNYRGSASRKAFWVFEAESEYRPGRRIMKDRILLAFDFGAEVDKIIRNEANWVIYPSPACKGETKHPEQVIVKENERGAYGIGAGILARLTVNSIRLATKAEIAKLLGLNIREVDVTPRW